MQNKQLMHLSMLSGEQRQQTGSLETANTKSFNTQRFVLHKKKYPYIKVSKTKIAEPLGNCEPPQPRNNQASSRRLQQGTGTAIDEKRNRGASFDLDWRKTERVGCDILRVQKIKAELSESVDDDGELKEESNRREEALTLILRSDERAPTRVKEKIKKYVESKLKRGYLEIDTQIVEPFSLASFERYGLLTHEATTRNIILIEQDRSFEDRDSESQEADGHDATDFHLLPSSGTGLVESSQEKMALFKAHGLRQSNFASLNTD